MADIDDRLTESQIRENAAEIDAALRALARPNIGALADWLKTTDFYSAPASTKYHLCCEGGLAVHSLNVWKCLKKYVEIGWVDIAPETVTLTALLHDVCKANFYVRTKKNVKENDRWVEKEVWTVKDPFPVGHGEKSCYLIQRYIQLLPEEYAMIRLHMGQDPNAYPDPFSASAAMWPSVAALHLADMASAYLLENRGDHPAPTTL